MNNPIIVVDWTSVQSTLTTLATILLIISSINYLLINKKQRKKLKELETLIYELKKIKSEL